MTVEPSREEELRPELAGAEDFDLVYPLALGRLSAEGDGPVCREEGSLLLWVEEGVGEALLMGNVHTYRPGCLLLAERAGGLELLPATDTKGTYLLLANGSGLVADGIIREGGGLGAEILRLWQNAREGLPGDVYGASAQVYRLLMEARRLADGQEQRYSELVRDAMAILREEYAYLSGIDELAERLEVSKSHLVRRFSAEAGVGPGRYLQEVRLEQAKLILAAEDHPIELVAGMTGYSCANYFCKVFRGAVGLSPGRYRELHRAARPGGVRLPKSYMELDVL